MQQMIFLQLLTGNSMNSMKKIINHPSISTCRRWWQWLKNNYLLFRDALCSHFSDLANTVDFIDFWQKALIQHTLSRCMFICNLAGVIIP